MFYYLFLFRFTHFVPACAYIHTHIDRFHPRKIESLHYVNGVDVLFDPLSLPCHRAPIEIGGKWRWESMERR